MKISFIFNVHKILVTGEESNFNINPSLKLSRECYVYVPSPLNANLSLDCSQIWHEQVSHLNLNLTDTHAIYH